MAIPFPGEISPEKSEKASMKFLHHEHSRNENKFFFGNGSNAGMREALVNRNPSARCAITVNGAHDYNGDFLATPPTSR